jgi:amino acid transporter
VTWCSCSRERIGAGQQYHGRHQARHSLFFIYVGAKYVKPENWSPFMLTAFPAFGRRQLIFCLYWIDAISTAAEECRNLDAICPSALSVRCSSALLYVAVAAVLTGMMPWDKLGVADRQRGARLGLRCCRRSGRLWRKSSP